jgi:hypothetical protein
LVNGLTGKTWRNRWFSQPRFTMHRDFNSIFGQFALKIWMFASYENCVPRDNKELLYWPILNFYSEIWRTCKKTKSAF